MLQILFVFCYLFSNYAYGIELSKKTSIKILIENNLELAHSHFDIEFHKANELTVGLWANPSLMIDSQLNPFGHNWNQETIGGPTQQDFIIYVPIDMNGKRSKAIEVARLATRVSEAYFQGIIREKIKELLTSLYSLKLIRNELNILIEKKELIGKAVDSFEKLKERDSLIQSRAKLILNESLLHIRSKKLEEKKEENMIRFLLKLVPHESIELENLNEKVIEKSFDSLKKQAIQERPDFRAMYILRKQRFSESELEKKKVWDDFIIQAGMSRQESVAARPGDTTSPSIRGAWSWLVGVTMPIPLFDRNQGSLMALRLQGNQIEVKLRSMEQLLEKDLINSLASLENQELTLKLFREQQLVNAKRIRDLSLNQFNSGKLNLLECLNAVDVYHSIASIYLKTEFEWELEKVNLKYISGMPF